MPYLDYWLVRHATRTRIALNIGGIANITVIPPRARPEDVIAYDTGPGNMVIDALAKEYSGGKLTFDRGGRIAAASKISVSQSGSVRAICAAFRHTRRICDRSCAPPAAFTSNACNRKSASA